MTIGDSHVRGCAAKMITSVDARFEVCGVINPGSCIESLSEIMKEEVGNLTANDFLIISSGSNDLKSSIQEHCKLHWECKAHQCNINKCSS